MKAWAHGVAIAAERVLGRNNLVRASRLMLDHARRDIPNNIDTNGEVLVQRGVSKRRTGLVVFDVGANMGQWSQRLQRAAMIEGVRSGELHLFEPAAATYDVLTRSVVGGPLRLVFNCCGLSDTSGETSLFKAHELAGSNSLYDFSDASQAHLVETIQLSTVDDYCEAKQVPRIHLLKSDAEGHDFPVMLGAHRMLSAKNIECVQFEYNYRWIGARRFLRDAMQYLEASGYIVGKVTPGGIEWYRRWDAELETFKEANFLAALPNLITRWPAVNWWKAL